MASPEAEGDAAPPALHDPWAALTPAAAFAELEEEEFTNVVVEEEDVLHDDLARFLELKAEQRVSDMELEAAGSPPACLGLIAADCQLTECPLKDYLVERLVALDLTGNKLDLEGLETLVQGGLVFLRELKVGGNKFGGAFPSQALALMPALLHLDFSFNPIADLATVDFAPLAGLMKLDLSGCDIETLEDAADGLKALVSLRELVLTENEIEGLDGVEALQNLPRLAVLDLTENEVCEVRGYKKKVLELLPGLEELDGDKTGTLSKGKYTGRLDYGNSGTEEIFQQNLDRSSCSCLEGNPCVQPDRCGDWKNRFTVAMNARRRKGLVVGYDAT